MLLSIGYMVSGGLAKAGSRQHDDAGEAQTPSRVWPPPGNSRPTATTPTSTPRGDEHCPASDDDRDTEQDAEAD